MLLVMQMVIQMLQKSDGVIGKVTYSWNPSDDIMYYVTWSEGFRPGLLNRPVGRTMLMDLILLNHQLILMKLLMLNLVGKLF